MTNPATIIQAAIDLQANHNKLEIAGMARGLGWRGDQARAPILQLALYVATKLASAERPQQDDQQGQQDDQQGQQDDQQGQQDDQQGQQDDQQDDDEYKKLLAASGIVKPHRLLEKVWRLAVKAKQNVLLVGPAGSGKTMLSEQLAQLVRVPFASVSCTMGMSESQLTGWLLPVGDNGRFEYVASPFVRAIQQPSVFLFDEFDAADPNVLMLANSVLSNGFISVAQNHAAPMVKRHDDAIVIAGANTIGSGADDVYSARSALDGATLDRFYPVLVAYDEDYEHGIFAVEHKSRKKSAAWEKGPAVDQIGFNSLRDWFFALRSKAGQRKINRIVSSRLASRLVAAVKAGVPVREAQQDLLMYWTDDELLAIGFSDVRS